MRLQNVEDRYYRYYYPAGNNNSSSSASQEWPSRLGAERTWPEQHQDKETGLEGMSASSSHKYVLAVWLCIGLDRRGSSDEADRCVSCVVLDSGGPQQDWTMLEWICVWRNSAPIPVGSSTLPRLRRDWSRSCLS